jgi:hypothetical protein
VALALLSASNLLHRRLHFCHLLCSHYRDRLYQIYFWLRQITYRDRLYQIYFRLRQITYLILLKWLQMVDKISYRIDYQRQPIFAKFFA